MTSQNPNQHEFALDPAPAYPPSLEMSGSMQVMSMSQLSPPHPSPPHSNPPARDIASMARPLHPTPTMGSGNTNEALPMEAPEKATGNSDNQMLTPRGSEIDREEATMELQSVRFSNVLMDLAFVHFG